LFIRLVESSFLFWTSKN